jgi:hypothetical protein
VARPPGPDRHLRGRCTHEVRRWEPGSFNAQQDPRPPPHTAPATRSATMTQTVSAAPAVASGRLGGGPLLPAVSVKAGDEPGAVHTIGRGAPADRSTAVPDAGTVNTRGGAAGPTPARLRPTTVTVAVPGPLGEPGGTTHAAKPPRTALAGTANTVETPPTTTVTRYSHTHANAVDGTAHEMTMPGKALEVPGELTRCRDVTAGGGPPSVHDACDRGTEPAALG